MLFNSYIFIFGFLPITLLGFFTIAKRHGNDAAKLWLTGASLFFYAWLGKEWVFLLLGSAWFNFIIAKKITAVPDRLRNYLLTCSVLINISLLAYFKYSSPITNALNLLFSQFHFSPQLILPLAISYFTFHQIAYLVDVRIERITAERRFSNYLLFVTFFPHLLAGPIVYYRDIMPQLLDRSTFRYNTENIKKGLFLFSLGLVKKTLMADSISGWVETGFSHAENLNQLETIALAYLFALQLYFDFSGYSDMALGLARLFNINFPLNFNSPYKTTSIIQFWQHWNITLTNFINSYVYTPLVRARKSFSFYYSLFATFIAMTMIGIWHGATMNYVLFGMLHGMALIINHLWRKAGIKINAFACWFITLNFWALSLMLFRSTDLYQASHLYQKIITMSSDWTLKKEHFISESSNFYWLLTTPEMKNVMATLHIGIVLILGYAICLLFPNAKHIADHLESKKYFWIKLGAALTFGLMMIGDYTPFIYFQF